MYWPASSFRLQILRKILSVFASSFPFLSWAHSIQAFVLHRHCSCQSCQDVAPPPTPQGSCQVRYDSVLRAPTGPASHVWHSGPPPPPWNIFLTWSPGLSTSLATVRSSPLLDLTLYMLESPRDQLLQVFSNYLYFLGNLHQSQRFKDSYLLTSPKFISLTKTYPWNPDLNIQLPLLCVCLYSYVSLRMLTEHLNPNMSKAELCIHS